MTTRTNWAPGRVAFNLCAVLACCACSAADPAPGSATATDAAVGGGAGGAGGMPFGGSGGTGAVGGSGGALTGGAAGQGGSAGAGGAAGGAGGGGALTCSKGGQSLSYTVTNSDQFRRIPLPLKPGVEYRRLKLAFTYTPTEWGDPCYNPATQQKTGFPKFETLVALKRGNHWCKGGNLFGITLQGPASGHGANNKANAQTHFKFTQHTGGGCGSTDIEAKIFNATHGLSEGGTYQAEVVYDGIANLLTADLGPTQHAGNTDPGLTLIANGGEVWNVVLSFDGGYLECYGPGGPDPSAPCCYGPSVGWTFQDLSWELCY